MGKRLFVIVTVLLLAAIFTGWYLFVRESKYFGTSPLKAVPADAPIFVRVHNLGDFAARITRNESWKYLRNLDGLSGLYKDFAFLDSLIRKEKAQEDLLRHKEMIVVPGDSSRLYLLEIGSISEKNGFAVFIKNFFQSKNILPVEKEFKHARVEEYEWKENGAVRRFVVTFYKGMLMICSDYSGLGKALDQLDQPDINYLRAGKSITQNIDLNVFVNHQTFPSFCSGLCNDSAATGILRKGYAKWTEVDLIQKDNQLLINGFTIPDTTKSSVLDLFKKQKPIPGNLTSLLPSTTTFFLAINSSSPTQYLEDYAIFLQNNGRPDENATLIAELTKALNMDIGKYLRDNWSGEAAAVFTNRNREDASDNKFLLLKMKATTDDPLSAALKKWVKGIKNGPGDFEYAEGAKNNIWKMPREDFGKLVGEPCFGSIKTKWVTFGSGYLLMGPTVGSLKRYVNLLQRSELLQETRAYSGLRASLANSYNFFMWSAPGHSIPFFSTLLRPELFQRINDQIAVLKKVENVAWQWGIENGLVYNTAVLTVNPVADNDPVPFWRYPIKAQIRNIPSFISLSSKNPQRELVFQDTDNNLINLDKDGIERWKIKLGGPILGDIKIIDYYKSREFQLLFNTEKAIHLIGRNGVEIKNYPIRLRSSATTELSVFDDGKRDYRYLVTCRDRKVYNFDKYGKQITGVQAKLSKKMIKLPSISENKSFLVREDGSIISIFLPSNYTVKNVGSFDEKSGVSNVIAYTEDGFLSNFQMIVK